MGTKWEVANDGTVDFKQSGTLNLVLETDINVPGSGVEGQVFWESDTDILYVHNGTSFLAINGSSAGGWTDSGVIVALTTSTDQVQVGTGSAGTPSLAFISDPNSGVYSVGADQVGISTNGILRLTVSTSAVVSTLPVTAGNLTIGSGSITDSSGAISFGDENLVTTGTLGAGAITATGVITAPVGSASLPSFTFSGDPDLGIYRGGVNILNMSTNGTSRMSIDASGNITMGTSATLEVRGDTSPQFTIKNDTSPAFNVTIDHAGTFKANNAANGNITLNNNGVIGYKMINSGQSQFIDGSASAPGISFIDDPDTGIFHGGSGRIDFSSNNFNSVTFDGTDISSALRFRGPNGTEALPAFSFTGDTNSGLTRIGEDNLLMSTNGVARMNWTNTTIEVKRTMIPSPNNTYSLGNSTFRWTEVFATNGTINVSHSSTKQNIRDLEEIPIPRAVKYERDGRDYIGYLNDLLPIEARPKDSTIDNYENSVVGVLCHWVQKLKDEVDILKAQINN